MLNEDQVAVIILPSGVEASEVLVRVTDETKANNAKDELLAESGRKIKHVSTTYNTIIVETL